MTSTPKPDNPIFAISARAEELRAQGKDVIVLAAGEPDSPTPAHIVAAAQRAISDPVNHRYGTTAGLPALREAIAATFSVSTGLPWKASDVLVTLGTKHALYLALNTVAGVGDDVLVASPGWPGHRGAALAAGATPRPVPVNADDNFLVTVPALEAAWTPKSRALILASPANPTGSVYSAEQLSAIAEWARRRDMWLIIDDIYDAFVYDRQHVSLLAVAPESRDRCILVNGVSKAHAMTGWRVGWLAGPPEIVAAASTVVSRTITHVPLITQAAALEALTGDPTVLREASKTYRGRRDRLVEALNAVPGVECPRPDGGMYVFPSVDGVLSGNRIGLTSATELGAWLLEEAGVAVVPGEAFDAPGRLRLCFAVGDETLDLAAKRLTAALTSIVDH